MTDRRLANRISIVITVLFVAWIFGWLWWLAVIVGLYAAARVGWAFYWQHRSDLALRAAARAELVARADQQHQWVMRGDMRGTYGDGTLAWRRYQHEIEKLQGSCVLDDLQHL